MATRRFGPGVGVARGLVGHAHRLVAAVFASGRPAMLFRIAEPREVFLLRTVGTEERSRTLWSGRYSFVAH